MLKSKAIEKAIEIQAKREGSELVVLELGRLRNAKPHYAESDGWSTLRFAESRHVLLLVSIDTDPSTLAECLKFKAIDDAVGAKRVRFLPGIEHLFSMPFDLILLDTENDPDEAVGLYKKLAPNISPSTALLVDDVYSIGGKKGDKLVPLLEADGYTVEQFGAMAFASKK